MDALERLSVEQAGEPTLIALTHVHRYELAAGLCADLRVLDLCCGTGYGARILASRAASVHGVDVDEAAVEQARAASAESNVSFERADALEVLDRDLAGDYDAIVMFEGLEHLADSGRAIERLREHARAGLRLAVSIPNDGSFEEENPFHLESFDLESVREIGEGFEDAEILGQTHAEGSLIAPLGEEEGGTMEAEVVLPERWSADDPNHFILIAGFADGARRSSRMQLTVAAAFHEYMLALERQNATLWRTNQQLARAKLGVADSAAAAAQQRAEQAEEARRRAEAMRRRNQPAERAKRRVKQLVYDALPHGLTRGFRRRRGYGELEGPE